VSARGAANPNWHGGRRRGGEGGGYWLVYAPEHPAAVAGAVLEHRLVMEGDLGRYLERTEVVHHRNGDTLDNRLENLELLTQPDHARHHMIERIHNGYRYAKPLRPRIALTCEQCDGTYEVIETRSSGRRFCSQSCYWAYRRGRGRLERGVAA